MSEAQTTCMWCGFEIRRAWITSRWVHVHPSFRPIYRPGLLTSPWNHKAEVEAP